MSNNFLGLRTAIYKVSDLQAAKKWYEKILGIAPYFDQPYYIGFNIGGFELGLHPAEGEIIEGNDIEIYWGVEDIEKIFQTLIENGAMEVQKPMNVGGEIMVATVKDPWGNIFGIIHNPEFKTEN